MWEFVGVLVATMFALLLGLILKHHLFDKGYHSTAARGAYGERRLSRIEKYCKSRRDFIGCYNLTAMVTVKDLIPENKLREALSKLQSKYAILRAAINPDPFNPNEFVFEVLNNAAEGTLVVDQEFNEGDQGVNKGLSFILEQEVNNVIHGPLLFRCRAVYQKSKNETHLAFTVDHSITDGTGLAIFLKQWILLAYDIEPGCLSPETYGFPKLQLTGTQIDTKMPNFADRKVSIPPSADHFYPIPRYLLTIWSLFKLAWLVKGGMQPGHMIRSHRAIRYVEDRKLNCDVKFHTIVVERDFTKEETKQIMEMCKKSNCTVGTAIHTALSITTSEDIEESHQCGHCKCPKLRQRILGGTNVDLRRMVSRSMPNYRDTEGLCTGFYGGFTFLTGGSVDQFLEARKNKATFWKMAADLKVKCQKEFRKGGHLYISEVVGISAVQKAVDFINERYLKGKERVLLEVGFLLSNMGNVGGGLDEIDSDPSKTNGIVGAKPALFPREELSKIPPITGVHAAVTAIGPGAQPLVGAITYDNRLKMFICVSAAGLNRKAAERFLERSSEILLGACK